MCRRTNTQGVSVRELALPLVCPVVMSPTLTSCDLGQAGELAPGLREWENWPCSSLAAALSRAGPVPHLGSWVMMALVSGISGKPALRAWRLAG